jgi:MFS transporter, DHA3 family, tetracycline resistance protein
VAATISYPIESAWLNRNLDSTSRATVISMVGQASAIGQVAGGPPLGALAGATSIRTTLTVSGLILFPIPLLYLRLRPDAQRVVPAAEQAEAVG